MKSLYVFFALVVGLLSNTGFSNHDEVQTTNRSPQIRRVNPLSTREEAEQVINDYGDILYAFGRQSVGGVSVAEGAECAGYSSPCVLVDVSSAEILEATRRAFPNRLHLREIPIAFRRTNTSDIFTNPQAIPTVSEAQAQQNARKLCEAFRQMDGLKRCELIRNGTRGTHDNQGNVIQVDNFQLNLAFRNQTSKATAEILFRPGSYIDSLRLNFYQE